jgi:uncharacterized protein YkwD
MMLAAGLVLAATAGRAPAADAPATPVETCAGATDVPTDQTTRQAASDAVLCLINVERAERGLAAVRVSTLLTSAAVFHAGDMVRRKYFSHITPSGQGLLKRIMRTGYLRGARRPQLGETLAWGSDMYASPAELVESLMESAEHKAIVLDGRFRDIGVGLVLGAPMDDMGTGDTLTLNFGRR